MSRQITIVSLLCVAGLAPSFAANAQETAPQAAPAQPTPSTAPPPPTAADDAPIFAGTVEAQPVQPAPPAPPPPPPPGDDAYYAQHPHACAGGQCVQRCRYGRCWYERAPEPDDGRRHTGLLLRATTGWGYGPLVGTKRKVEEGSLALGVSFDAGAAVIENLIVRGRLRASALGFSDSDFGDDVLFTFGAIGAGIDYYFMPANIYLGATLSLVGASCSNDDDTLHSKAGFGVDLDLGKEWWLGNHWGVGLALRATLDQVGGANIERGGSLRSFHAGLQFSATYD
jgi:hypothetical protein